MLTLFSFIVSLISVLAVIKFKEEKVNYVSRCISGIYSIVISFAVYAVSSENDTKCDIEYSSLIFVLIAIELVWGTLQYKRYIH